MKSKVIRPGSLMAAILAAACSSGDERALIGAEEKNVKANESLAPQELPPGARVIGTAQSVLAGVTRSALSGKGKPTYALPDTEGQPIALDTKDYFFDGDDLSMHGATFVEADSSFILKGSGTNLYGWIVLPGLDVAFEYTTNARGEVIVARVPVTKIYPICDTGPDGAPAHDHPHAVAPGRQLEPPHVGPYANQDTAKLQSKPGATKVLFMDMGVLTLEKGELWKAWQTVASSYSAFDVNVTTDKAVYDAAGVKNSGKSCYNNSTGRSSCSLNAFGTTKCCNIYNKGNGYYEGTTSAHEFGHLMGMSHDGGEPGGEYFSGFPALKWCPIMGSNIPKTDWGDEALFQWSKGEYTSATQTQDDLVIITKNLPYRADDIPTTKTLAIQGGMVSSDLNRGQIATNTDTDTFTFRIGTAPGHATLNINRIEFVGGAYLDVDAQLLDGAGTKVAVSNEKVARNARFDVDLMPGDYRIVIAGGAELTPQTGFSNYSSLGFYGISGTITGAIDTGGTGGMAGAGGSAGAAGTGGAAGTAGAAGAAGFAGKAGGAGAGGTAGSAGSGGTAGTGGAGAGGTAGQDGGSGKAGTGGVGGSGGTSGTGGGGAGAGGKAGSGGTGGQAGTGVRDAGEIRYGSRRKRRHRRSWHRRLDEHRRSDERYGSKDQSPIRARRLQLHHGRPVNCIALGLVPCSLGRLGRLREARRKSAIAAQGLSNPLKVEGQREGVGRRQFVGRDLQLATRLLAAPSAEIQKAGAAPPHGQDRFRRKLFDHPVGLLSVVVLVCDCTSRKRSLGFGAAITKLLVHHERAHRVEARAIGAHELGAAPLEQELFRSSILHDEHDRTKFARQIVAPEDLRLVVSVEGLGRGGKSARFGAHHIGLGGLDGHGDGLMPSATEGEQKRQEEHLRRYDCFYAWHAHVIGPRS